MLAQIKKALYGAATYFLGTGALSVFTDGQVTVGELLTVVAGTPVAGFVVWKTKNAPAPFQATVQDDGL